MATGPRERLITGAIALIRERGVAGAGITELLARSNTARRSIYQHFPGGKAQLVEESTRRAGQLMGSVIASATATGDPAGSLGVFIRLWQDMLVASDFSAGCPVAAAALGGAEAPAARAAAADTFDSWRDLITDQLDRVGIEPGSARALATTVICAIEGAVILAICARSTQPLDHVRDSLTRLLDSHRTGAAPPLTS